MILNQMIKTWGWMAMVAACAVAASSRVSAARIYVPANYATIQGAVEAANAGDVILVAAGTYQEDQIVIDKPLSLWGAGAETTIIDGQGGSGQTTVGLIQIFAEGNVNLGGFTLIHAGDTAIWTRSPTVNSRYRICYNIIDGSIPDSPPTPYTPTEYGIWAGLDVNSNTGSKGSLIIERNTIAGTGANPILLEKHEGPTDISFNSLDVGRLGADAIFTMTYDGVNITSLQKRNNNFINVGTGIPSDGASGITFGSSFNSTDGTFERIQIMRNVITDVIAGRRGISVWNGELGADGSAGNIVAPQIVGNVIMGVDSAAPDSKGIQLIGLVSHTKIINNEVAKLNIGVHLWNLNGSSPQGTKIISTKFRDVETRVKSDAGVTGTKQRADHIFISP